MDCFPSCFGIKYFIRRKSHMFSRSFSCKIWELVVRRNHYASLESSKEKGSSYGKAEWDIIDVDDSIHQGLRQESKIRKTCGNQHCTVPCDACDERVNYEEQLDKPTLHPSNVAETSTFSQENSKSCQFEHPGQISPQTENQMGCESPYPTPLNLAAGMQTPGTVYPPKPQSFRVGMIRTQFVYAVPDLSQSTFESNVGEEDSQNLQKIQHGSQYKEARDEEELSNTCCSGPDAGMPVIVAVLDEEVCCSAMECAEDQKVSWKQLKLPFEMRLEKVLSDENVYYP